MLESFAAHLLEVGQHIEMGLVDEPLQEHTIVRNVERAISQEIQYVYKMGAIPSVWRQPEKK